MIVAGINSTDNQRKHWQQRQTKMREHNAGPTELNPLLWLRVIPTFTRVSKSTLHCYSGLERTNSTLTRLHFVHLPRDDLNRLASYHGRALQVVQHSP